MGLIQRLTDVFAGTTVDQQRGAAGPRLKVIGPRPDHTITPPPRFAWDEKGWQRAVDGAVTRYTGKYRVYDFKQRAWRTFNGCVIASGGAPTAFIADPPVEIKSHPKGPCFQLTTAPWFRIHWRQAPGSVDEALLYVERLLDECINGWKR